MHRRAFPCVGRCIASPKRSPLEDLTGGGNRTGERAARYSRGRMEQARTSNSASVMRSKLMVVAFAAVAALALWFGVLRGSTDENIPKARQTVTTSVPLSLSAAQGTSLFEASDDFLRLLSSLFSDVIGCARTGGGPECIRPAVAELDESAHAMRRTVSTLAAAVEGNCAAFLRGIDDPLDAAVETVRAVSDAARRSDYEEASGLAEEATDTVGTFVDAVAGARKECAPSQ